MKTGAVRRPLAAGRALLAAALISTAVAAACPARHDKDQNAMKTPPVVARLEIPERTLLLHEQMVLADPDRTGNSRFLFREDGSFFSARNTRLWVTDPAQQNSDDPALFWSAPLPDKPARRLTPEQLASLQAAIRKTNFAALERYYPATQRTNSLQVERWTAVIADPGKSGQPGSARTYTVLVESKAAPPPLVALQKIISELVAAAPRTAP